MPNNYQIWPTTMAKGNSSTEEIIHPSLKEKGFGPYLYTNDWDPRALEQEKLVIRQYKNGKIQDSWKNGKGWICGQDKIIK